MKKKDRINITANLPVFSKWNKHNLDQNFFYLSFYFIWNKNQKVGGSYGIKYNFDI